MREILFRGKSKGEGRWYDGYYIHVHQTTYCVKEDYDADPDNEIHQIVFEQMTDWGLPNKHYRVDVIPETVGQYTGLTDKNGKKIFEGDIVAYEDTPASDYYQETIIINRGVVEYADGEFFVTERETVTMGDLVYEGTTDCEIIGNIHDNPELLEVDE